MKFKLNQLTAELIEKAIMETNLSSQPPEISESGQVELSDIIQWLRANHKKSGLNAVTPLILHDIYRGLNGKTTAKISKDKSLDWLAVLKLAVFSLLGVILTAAESFDCAVTLAGTFCELLHFSLSPALISSILAACIIFSCLAYLAYHVFQKINISKILQVSYSDANEAVDNCSRELRTINHIVRKSQCLKNKTLEELHLESALLVLLEERLKVLNETFRKLKTTLNSTGLKVVKIIVLSCGALITFGLGFYSGQFAVTHLLITAFSMSAASAFWPILVMGLAFAFLTAFLYLRESAVIEKNVALFFGFDRESIIADASEKRITVDETAVQILKANIEDKIVILEKIQYLEKSSKIPLYGRVLLPKNHYAGSFFPRPLTEEQFSTVESMRLQASA